MTTHRVQRSLLDARAFLQVVSGTEELHVRRGDRRAAAREWKYVIEVEVVTRAALDALAAVASPDFEFDRRRDNTRMWRVNARGVGLGAVGLIHHL